MYQPETQYDMIARNARNPDGGQTGSSSGNTLPQPDLASESLPDGVKTKPSAKTVSFSQLDFAGELESTVDTKTHPKRDPK